MKPRLTEQAPMLTAAILLTVGIALASWRMPSVWISAAGMAVGTATAAVSLRANRTVAAVSMAAAILFLGSALTALHMRNDSLPDGYAVYELEISNDTYRRTGSKTQQGDARIISHRDSDGIWHRIRGRVRIYADTTLHLSAGQRAVCRGRVRPFDGSDGYGAMMRRKGYAGRLYLSIDNILQISDERPYARLRELHRQAVAKIAALPLRAENMPVAQALGTGETSLLERGQRAQYSRAGTAHLLALSGLHVGIVYLIINLLLKWLPLLSFGHIIRNGAAVILLWSYVLSTGMPPSAIRAALMFSMLQISQATSADYAPLNALSGAAFISLCVDPSLLFDAGFRLSYIAVAAIILCAVPLCRQFHVSLKHAGNIFVKSLTSATNYIIDTITVGFVATAATAPMVSHLFGVIPLAGIIAAPAAIVAAAATVALTAIWIALPLGFAATQFGYAVDISAGAMNAISEWLATRPWAAIEIRLSSTATAICYAVVIVALSLLTAIMNRQQKKPHRR